MNLALFLVGGPGSGKDIVLKEALSQFDIKEFNTEQVKSIVKKFFREIVVITGNAYNLKKIKECNELLENAGYVTGMIYVDVSDEVSKERLSKRNLSEDIRNERLNESKNNFQTFSNMFTNFYLIRNDFDSESEDLKVQLEALIEELSEDLRIGSSLADKRKSGIKASVDAVKRADKKQHNDVNAEIAARKLTGHLFANTKAFHNNKTKKIMKNADDFKQRLRHESVELCPILSEGFNSDKETEILKKLKKKKILVGTSKGTPVRGDGIGPTFDLRNSGEYRLGGMLNTMASEEHYNCDDFFEESIDSPSSESGLAGVESGSSNKMPLTRQSSSYVYDTDGKKKKKPNFQKDKESVKNESVLDKSRKIIFKDSTNPSKRLFGIKIKRPE